jgi:hypothetical protein
MVGVRRGKVKAAGEKYPAAVPQEFAAPHGKPVDAAIA